MLDISNKNFRKRLSSYFSDIFPREKVLAVDVGHVSMVSWLKGNNFDLYIVIALQNQVFK